MPCVRDYDDSRKSLDPRGSVCFVYKWRLRMMDFFNVVRSFLGPNKCMKFVIEDDQMQAVSCPADYLSILPYKTSLSQFVNSAVQSHHDKYINGTTTLISYVYVFHDALIETIKQGNDPIEVCKTLRSDLESCVKYSENKSYCLISRLKSEKNARKDLSPSVQRILATSRHFHVANSENDEAMIGPSMLVEMQKIVARVCHCEREREMSSLLVTAWTNQIEQRKRADFSLDTNRIHVLSLLGNTRSSRVIPGIVISTRQLNDIYFSNTQKSRRGLLISGNVNYDYNHRGYNESIKSQLVLTSDNFLAQTTRSNDWIKCVVEKLKSMQIDLLLVQGSVDDKLLDECLSSQILVIANIADKLFHDLSKSLRIATQNYILDCDESNIVSNISIEHWTTDDITNRDNYVLIKTSQQIQTLVICSSCAPLACAKEHSVRHLIHRLSSSLSSAIDGGGKAEDDCISWLRTVNKERSLLADAFRRFVRILRDNCELSDNRHDVVDAFRPKTEAWLSALHVATTLVTTDAIVLVGDENALWECIEHCKYNFLGHL